MSEAQWREIWGRQGGQAECQSPQWLLNGCPKCDSKDFDVTNDRWAYCRECNLGISCAFPFTDHLLARLMPDGSTVPLGGDDD